MAGEAVFLGGCGLRGLAVVVKNGGCFGGRRVVRKTFQQLLINFRKNGIFLTEMLFEKVVFMRKNGQKKRTMLSCKTL